MTLEQLQSDLESLRADFELLKNKTTIPFEIDVAFRDRFKLDTYTSISASSKTVASETQAVNEGGAASYNVPKLHDGFIETVIGGSTIYIPYYT